MKRIRINVFGKVQGVWFRKCTLDKAREIGLTGWVKNQPDGSVLIEAQGSNTDLNRFIHWCHQGSPMSKVDDVVQKKIPITQESQFLITR